MRAVVTIVGRDAVGILAKASAVCARHNANIIDVNQSVMGELFTMVMLADIDQLDCDFSVLSDDMEQAVAGQGLVAHVMHEDIFNAMHRI